MDKACLGLSEEKNKGFSIFGVHPGSWWIELKWPEGAFISPLSCLPPRLSPSTSLCPPSPMVQNVTFAVVIGEEKLVWQWWGKCQERHPRRCREDTLQKTKKKTRRKQQQPKNKKLLKFHSGTNVTAQSRAAEAPDDGPMTLHLWRRPQKAVMSIQNGSAGFCHAIYKSLSPADPGQEEQRCSC